MDQPNFLMIRIDPDTKAKLQELAERNERNMSAQVRWLIAQEWAKLEIANNQPNNQTANQIAG